jgi:small subunit ribosomal protein S8
MHSDPIADLLTRIRNGAQARLATVQVPHSKIKLEILRILQAEGYIKSFEVTTETKFPAINIQMRYDHKRNPVISKIQRVSKPGLRIYKANNEIKPIRSGLATLIISTSQGVMTDRDARRKHVGGEVICEVW